MKRGLVVKPIISYEAMFDTRAKIRLKSISLPESIIHRL